MAGYGEGERVALEDARLLIVLGQLELLPVAERVMAHARLSDLGEFLGKIGHNDPLGVGP